MPCRSKRRIDLMPNCCPTPANLVSHRRRDVSHHRCLVIRRTPSRVEGKQRCYPSGCRAPIKGDRFISTKSSDLKGPKTQEGLGTTTGTGSSGRGRTVGKRTPCTTTTTIIKTKKKEEEVLLFAQIQEMATFFS
jgi:hypothetical protein